MDRTPDFRYRFVMSSGRIVLLDDIAVIARSATAAQLVKYVCKQSSAGA